MPRAEIGSTKHISNQMKSKGLQRLRWYCQACSRQMRDENGFKCHVASESHVRNMMLIGEDPRKAINDYSQQFQSDFLKLLRTGHVEKKINVNHFYQEYISNKEHVHMNSTRWASLTEFAKFLGREGICRVMEEEADGNGRGGGLMISWIDNSPEALRKQDALKKKERQDRGDEEREWKGIREQIARARKDGLDEDDDDEEEARTLQRKEGEKIKLSFGGKKVTTAVEEAKEDTETKPPSPPLTDKGESSGEDKAVTEPNSKPTLTKPPLKLAASASKPKNILASTPKTNPLSMSKKPKPATAPSKPMSQAERIMREEIERKQRRETNGGGGNAFKRQRIA
jgi:DNA/RNA-binding protein KIN17